MGRRCNHRRPICVPCLCRSQAFEVLPVRVRERCLLTFRPSHTPLVLDRRSHCHRISLALVEKGGHIHMSRRMSLLVLALVLLALPAPALAAEDSVEDTFSFPQDPLVTEFTNSWGDARSGGRGHRGTDLMAPKGSPVSAMADGVVTIVRDGGRAGRWVAIEHAGGWESWYMHLNNDNPGTDDGAADWSLTVAPGIEEGAQVIAGQLIGWVGDSGNAEPSSPHTHFELHRDGAAVNPYPYLVDAYEKAVLDAADEILPAVRELISGMGSIQLRPIRQPE